MAAARRLAVSLPVLALVAGLAACTGSTNGDPDDSSPATAGPSSGSCRPGEPDPSVYPNDLAAELTDAIQSHDGKAFTGLATTDQARSGMARWWANNDAIGFTTGSASVPDLVDSGNTVTLDIGVHNKFDPNDTEHKPMVAAAQYRVSVAFGGSDCKQLQITNWTPTENAPWDSIAKIYVRRTHHVVVAGTTAHKKQIDRIAALGEKAANWDKTILTRSKHGDYMEQSGFVVFVASNAKDTNTWFRPPKAKKPNGWTADAGNVAGFEFPMHGAPTPIGAKPKTEISGLPNGASRVVISQAGASENDKTLEGTLVHEFVHDIFRVDDIWSWSSGTPIEASTAEGAARWFEAMYDAHPAPVTQKSTFSSLDLLGPVVKSRHFGGRMPSDGEIYGAEKDADYYYDLSATGFSYLASAYGIDFAFQCVHDAYLNGGGPFGGVLRSNKNDNLLYWAPDKIEAKWAEWVRAGFPLPPHNPLR